ncbi:PepSY-associated TM helix domain-containing protein [Pedobacter immunditicola]|uniref:PepSY-associated TM helix domain-containing protein n=1 Tax=Pedobacter immunditicola TaxID=3133440 RepID=UPI0030A8733E
MLRKTFLWLHKWLGLITGLVVMIVSLTGCINVFADELKAYFYHERYYAEPVGNGKPLNFSELRDQAQKAVGPNIKLTRGEIYPAKGRTWVFRASLTDKKAIGHWNHHKYYYRIYVNPSNGKVVHVEDTRNEFFQLMLNLHMNLLLGDAVGTMVTGISALCFFVLLLSGLVLWFPRKWKTKAFKKGLVFKRDVGIKRLNYDLHNISGFYILIPAILICVTGLVFAFPWADQSVQFLANGGKTIEKRVIPLSTPNDTFHPQSTDSAIAHLLHLHPQADVLAVRFREKNTDPLDVQVRLAKNRTHLFEWYYFDRNNGKLLMKFGDQDVKGGEKFRTMNYDLHTGAYAGMPTKFFGFFVSLICATLPVSGFLIWYNKGKKNKKQKNKNSPPEKTSETKVR